MTKLLLVGCGGFLGAIARYWLNAWVAERWPGPVPLGTLSVNVLGCFVLGLFASYLATRPGLSPQATLFLRVGLLGAFTTFSTLGIESVELLEQGNWRAAGLSILANLVLGLGAVAVGAGLARRLFEG